MGLIILDHKKPITDNTFEYQEFVSSVGVYVSAELQEKIKNTGFLIAGNGSIGNPIAMMLARSGAENIIIADPEDIEISNLARQEFTFDQLGKNKAEMTTQNIQAINPRTIKSIKSISKGITAENVEVLVAEADIVVDGIDIRSSDMTWLLHKYACFYKKPVIVGYDLAGTALLTIFRYDQKRIKPLKGNVSEETILTFQRIKKAYQNGDISEAQFLNYVYQVLTGPINPFLVPIEQLKEIVNRKEDETSTSQVGTTARLISVLTVEAIKIMLSGEKVREIIAIDIPSVVRAHNPSVVSKMVYMIKALMTINRRGVGVKEMLNTLNNDDLLKNL